MFRHLLFLLLLFPVLHSSAQSIALRADSLRIFAPGIISDGFDNRDMAISPDNSELFFTIQYRAGTYSVVLHSRRKNGQWSTPEVAPFSGRYNDLETSFTPDGKRIYFSSNRPLTDTGSEKDYDIWYADKQGDSWGPPVNAGRMINTGKDEFFAYFTRKGNLYFTRDNDSLKDDIWMAPAAGNGFGTPHPLPATVNSPSWDFNAYVDPDERFLIFSSYKRGDDKGGDLYISLNRDGDWQTARNIGLPFNSPTLDYSPFVSYDGKYFFFTSRRTLLHFPLSKKMKAAQIKQVLFSAGNGSEDIYICNFSLLKDFLK